MLSQEEFSTCSPEKKTLGTCCKDSFSQLAREEEAAGEKETWGTLPMLL